MNITKSTILIMNLIILNLTTNNAFAIRGDFGNNGRGFENNNRNRNNPYLYNHNYNNNDGAEIIDYDNSSCQSVQTCDAAGQCTIQQNCD